MNLKYILQEIEAADPEFQDRVSPRRAAIRTFMRGASLAALPVALGGLFKKAYGKTTDVISDTLNFALKLEYLEASFYANVLANASTLGLSGPALQAVTTIREHEAAHVKFLQAAIAQLQAVVGASPIFDFSGGAGSGTGYFADALTTNYPKFLALAQIFEDTGVRAYKGQATNLKENNEILTAALAIHSVEARHAAHIRRMRAANGADPSVRGTLKPWITGSETAVETGDPAINAIIARSYEGENTTVQGGNISVTRFAVSEAVATESFDEPLSKEQVTAIITPFIKP